MMRRNVQMHWKWIAVVLLVLFGAVWWELRDVVALTPAAPAAVGTSAMIPITPESSAFDEQHTSNELEA
ncbi:MAG: hypothetical protein P8189_12320 [Anaerolineae bacterium]|jgi:hypothetical protein